VVIVYILPIDFSHEPDTERYSLSDGIRAW